MNSLSVQAAEAMNGEAWKGPLVTNEEDRRRTEATNAEQWRGGVDPTNGYRTFRSGSGLWYQPLPGYRIVAVRIDPPKSPNATGSATTEEGR